MSTPTHDDVFASVVNDMMMELHPLAHSTTTIHRLLVNNIDSPVLTAIQHMSLSNLSTKQMAGLLPALEKMINLTSLQLPSCDASPDQLKFLFTECTALSKLQSFDLSHAEELMSQDLSLLSQSTTLTNLTSLNFSGCDLTASHISAAPENGFDGGADSASEEEPEPPTDSSGLIALLSSPVVKNLTHLNLGRTRIRDPLVHIAIATSPHLSNLVWLDLSGGNLRPDAAKALAASTTLVNITHFNLTDAFFGDESLAQLFAPPSLLATKLQSLDISNTYITVSSLQVLQKACPHLVELILKHNRQLGPDGVAFIATHMPNLTKLGLSVCNIADEGYAALAASTTLTNLRELALKGNLAEKESIIALINSPVMTNLTHLNISHTRADSDVLTALAQSRATAKLEHLDFAGNPARNSGLIALSHSTTLTNLTWLNLSYNQIGPEGVNALCTSPVVAKLTHLCLDNNRNIDNSIAATLAAPSSTLYSLLELNLAYTGLDDAGLLPLLKAANLDQLDVLKVNEFTNEELYTLFQARFHQD
jgi:hypothetical protein